MRKTALFLILLSAAGLASAQTPVESKSQTLKPFDKIVVSPRINVVLQKGDQESIRVSASNLPADKIIVFVSGHKLRVYLDGARMVEPMERVECDLHGHRDGRHKRSIYRNASVTAYITYRQLRQIEVRGDQEVAVLDGIETDKLKIRAYGEAEITLASLNTHKLKASLYGENHLTIRAGEAGHQVYRLFGENKIDTRGLQSESATTRIYGEGRVNLTASRQLVVNAFGEPVIRVNGSPRVNKGIVIGRTDIYLQ